LPLFLVLAFAVAFSHRTAPNARAAVATIVIDGKVVDESDKGIPGVMVTLWRGARGSPIQSSTGQDGSYRLVLAAGGTIDVTYIHSALGSATVNQLSGFQSHRISPVIAADPTKMSAYSAHAELQSIERLVSLAMMSPSDTPADVKEFLKGRRVVERVRALGKKESQGAMAGYASRPGGAAAAGNRTGIPQPANVAGKSKDSASVERTMSILAQSASFTEDVLNAYQKNQ
jgi:hypothetical protein